MNGSPSIINLAGGFSTNSILVKTISNDLGKYDLIKSESKFRTTMEKISGSKANLQSKVLQSLARNPNQQNLGRTGFEQQIYQQQKSGEQAPRCSHRERKQVERQPQVVKPKIKKHKKHNSDFLVQKKVVDGTPTTHIKFGFPGYEVPAEEEPERREYQPLLPKLNVFDPLR